MVESLAAATRILSARRNRQLRVVVILRAPGRTRAQLLDAIGLHGPALDALDVEFGVNSADHEVDMPLELFVEQALSAGARWIQVPERETEPWSALKASVHVIRSCHDLTGLDEALSKGASFCTLSPIFPTPSKSGHLGLGVDALFEATSKYPGRVLPLGGVSPSRWGLLASTGVNGVATIRHGADWLAFDDAL